MKNKFFVLLLLGSLLIATPCLAEGAKLSINNATVEQLSEVPGISRDLASEIVKYREEMGNIQTLDELMEIKGMSKEIIEKMKEKFGEDAILGSECNC